MQPLPCLAVLSEAVTLVCRTEEARTKAPPPYTALQPRNDTRSIVTLKPGLKTARQPPDDVGGGGGAGEGGEEADDEGR
jgi:hypothetical protein